MYSVSDVGHGRQGCVWLLCEASECCSVQSTLCCWPTFLETFASVFLSTLHYFKPVGLSSLFIKKNHLSFVGPGLWILSEWISSCCVISFFWRRKVAGVAAEAKRTGCSRLWTLHADQPRTWWLTDWLKVKWRMGIFTAMMLVLLDTNNTRQGHWVYTTGRLQFACVLGHNLGELKSGYPQRHCNLSSWLWKVLFYEVVALWI